MSKRLRSRQEVSSSPSPPSRSDAMALHPVHFHHAQIPQFA